MHHWQQADQFAEQMHDAADQTFRLVVAAMGGRQVESVGHTADGRHAKACRADKGEQLQHIVSGKRIALEPETGRHRRPMEQNRRFGQDAAAGLGQGETVDLAIRGQPDGPLRMDDDGRSVRQGEAGRFAAAMVRSIGTPPPRGQKSPDLTKSPGLTFAFGSE